MKTRSHVHTEMLDATPQQVFDLLVIPSAIRQWWGASHAIVYAREGGVWTAAWGDEDDPDYISTAMLVEFERPRRLVMKYGQYYARSGQLPFEFAADALTIFTIEPNGERCSLRVEQTGFPCDTTADDFYAACEVGWKNTFSGIREYLRKIDPE